MAKNNIYRRKISSEEAQEGYIMVLKNWLDFFPGIGVDFDLEENGAVRKARVESYHCECRGLELPHEHYFIRAGGLKQGEQIEIALKTGCKHALSRRNRASGGA